MERETEVRAREITRRWMLMSTFTWNRFLIKKWVRFAMDEMRSDHSATSSDLEMLSSGPRSGPLMFSPHGPCRLWTEASAEFPRSHHDRWITSFRQPACTDLQQGSYYTESHFQWVVILACGMLVIVRVTGAARVISFRASGGWSRWRHRRCTKLFSTTYEVFRLQGQLENGVKVVALQWKFKHNLRAFHWGL
ncbi:hypothetical protein EX30DRAFT_173231 [Ascodesmis nigricans]|uniref:Uncharacterized protein n=1 Tax=Ascodesmis nigricans TaxID=341454 RepID=A0A4V3SHX8_9PEZI|nr:hypothetical protein EX30DRAFT_173231 [Ascodesmis nigricans]